MKIEVRSKEKAAKFSSDKPWAAIQVATREGTWPDLKLENRKGVLRLFFPDYSFLTGNLEKAYPDLKGKLFDENFAQRIFNFVESQSVETLLVHCEAGISRSPAIAAAIGKIYQGEDAKKWFRTDPYRPNILVYHTMIGLAKKQGKIPDVPEDKSISEPPDLDYVDEVPLEIIDVPLETD